MLPVRGEDRMSNDDNPFIEDDPFAEVVKSVEDARRARNLADETEIKRGADFLAAYRKSLGAIVDMEFYGAVNSPALKAKLAERGLGISTRTPHIDKRELTIFGGRTGHCSLGFEPLSRLDGFRRVFGCMQTSRHEKDFCENLSEKIVNESVKTFVRYVLEANPPLSHQ
jgi:hypothetical protein